MPSAKDSSRLLTRVDDAVIGNVSGTWNFRGRFSITGYARNIGDKRYPMKISTVQTVGSPAVVGRVVGIQSDPLIFDRQIRSGSQRSKIRE